MRCATEWEWETDVVRLVDADDWQTQKRIRAKLQPPQVLRVCPHAYLFVFRAYIVFLQWLSLAPIFFAPPFVWQMVSLSEIGKFLPAVKFFECVDVSLCV